MSFHSLTMAFHSRSLFVIAMTLLMLQSSVFAQNRFGGNRAEDESRMRVLEFKRAPAQRHYFTIIGSVRLPGVFYTTDRDRVPLRELLAAAEGRSRDASRKVNVIREGKFVSRSFDLEGNSLDETVSSDEIVVVVPNPNAPSTNQQIIPVACVGLIDRPVVFPLSTEILTIRDLSQRLQLPIDAVETCRVLDPHGRQQTRVLLSGSVVVFDSRTVDANTLLNSQLLPPTVPIGHSNHELTQLPEASPAPVLDPEPYVPTPTIQANGVVEAVHEQTGLHSSEQPITAYIRSKDRLQQVSATELIAEANHAGQDTNVTPTLTVENRSQRRLSAVAAPLPPLMEDAGESKRVVSSDATSNENPKSSGWIGPWTVAIVVGLLAGICLWGAIVWSRFDRNRELVAQSQLESSALKTQRSVGNPSVQSILNQSIPMIEEEVIAPGDVPLHGEPIHPEVLSVDEALVQSDTTTASQDELEPDNTQDRVIPESSDSQTEAELEVVAEMPKRIGVSDLDEESATSQIIPKSVISLEDQDQFDVVLPNPEATEDKLGPLERALRSLAKEDAA